MSLETQDIEALSQSANQSFTGNDDPMLIDNSQTNSQVPIAFYLGRAVIPLEPSPYHLVVDSFLNGGHRATDRQA